MFGLERLVSTAPQTFGLATIPEELDLDQGWSIGEEAFAELVRQLRSHAPAQLVECGSGISTVRLALALPGTTITSLEHLPEWKLRAEQLLDKYGCSNARVVQSALVKQQHGGASYESYAIPDSVPSRIDALIIDGPPVFIIGGREAMLYRLYDRLAPGAMVILDDARRGPERRAARHWKSRYPRGFNEFYSPAGNGLLFCTKRDEVPFGTRPLVSLEQKLAVLYNRRDNRWSRSPTRDDEAQNQGQNQTPGQNQNPGEGT